MSIGVQCPHCGGSTSWMMLPPKDYDGVCNKCARMIVLGWIPPEKRFEVVKAMKITDDSGSIVSSCATPGTWDEIDRIESI